MTQASDEGGAHDLMIAAFEDYVRQRLAYYEDRKGLLNDLLKKDATMLALRGVRTLPGFVEAAFAAHESSSEETMMGNAWQDAIARASPNAIGGGDLQVEREGLLWIVQVKSGTNTHNYGSEAQDLRVLRRKVERASRDHHPGRRGVRPMVGIVKGDRLDKEEIYHSEDDKDVDGFSYRRMVGQDFREWISADIAPRDLIGALGDYREALVAARSARLESLTAELIERLDARGLAHDIYGIIELKQVEEEARYAARVRREEVRRANLERRGSRKPRK